MFKHCQPLPGHYQAIFGNYQQHERAHTHTAMIVTINYKSLCLSIILSDWLVWGHNPCLCQSPMQIYGPPAVRSNNTQLTSCGPAFSVSTWERPIVRSPPVKCMYVFTNIVGWVITDYIQQWLAGSFQLRGFCWILGCSIGVSGFWAIAHTHVPDYKHAIRSARSVIDWIDRIVLYCTNMW